MDTNAAIIEYLTTVMQKEDISVNALSKLAAIPQTSLNRYFNGGVLSVNTLTQVCAALKVSPQDVFDYLDGLQVKKRTKKSITKSIHMRQ